MQSLKVLVVDDHEGFRRSLLSFLRAQGGVEIIGEAADGIDAVEKAELLRPDLILMDFDMPGRSGFDATEEIKHRLPQTRVIILSMHGADEYRQRALQSLADGFIDKGSLKSGLAAILFDELLRRQSPDIRMANL